MTYYLCKKLIESGKTSGLQNKLDVFLLAGRISEEQYNELTAMLNVDSKECQCQSKNVGKRRRNFACF